MYRIYINDTALILSDFIPDFASSCQSVGAQYFDFKEFYKQVRKSRPETYLMVTKDPKKMFRKIRKAFTVIKAAGGIVKNEENQYLFIFRKGKWDLPKGKLDEGEKNRVAAEREVTEECGILISKVGKKLCKTWHVYEEKGQIVFKRTAWFNMEAKKQRLIPQLEEEITEARWVNAGDFQFIKENTFPLIKDIISLIEI